MPNVNDNDLQRSRIQSEITSKIFEATTDGTETDSDLENLVYIHSRKTKQAEVSITSRELFR